MIKKSLCKRKQYSIENIIFSFFFLGQILFLFWPMDDVKAAEFNRHAIISDQEFFDTFGMTEEEIKKFLESKKGFLQNYHTFDASKILKSAWEIIYEASQKYNINPKTILVLLQKEQSLIESKNPTDYNLSWATGFSRCDSCDPLDPLLQKFSGFGIQVDRAAWRFRYYVEHPEEFSFQIGKISIIDDGVVVVPANQATVNLYNYTPHLHGNENFWNIWQRYFARTYPDGSLLQGTGEPGVWLIQHGFKRPFFTRGALTSRFDFKKILSVKKADLDKYDTGAPIRFQQYALVRSPGGTVYLLDGDIRRGFRSKEVFRAIGFNPEEVVKVSWEDIESYREGIPIGVESLYPHGILFQDAVTGGVYYVQDGKKRPIVAKEILRTRFKNYPIKQISSEDLLAFPLDSPLPFQEGELITSPGYTQVFVISNGTKRPFASKEVFDKLGYEWRSIIHTSDRALEVHSLGEAITL